MRIKTAKDILTTALAALPKFVTLTYISYDDSLTDEQVQLLLGGDEATLNEEIFENFMDSADDGLNTVLEEAVPDEDEREILRDNDEAWAAFHSAVYDRDDSSPLNELIANTHRKMVRFHFKRDRQLVEFEDFNWMPAEEREAAPRKIAEIAGIDYDANVEAVTSLVEEASYGGKLCVIAYVEISDLYKAVDHLLRDPEKNRARITFTDPDLLINNSNNGSGYDTSVKGTVSFEFGKEDLSPDYNGIMQHDALKCGTGRYCWSDTAGTHNPAYKADPKIELL